MKTLLAFILFLCLASESFSADPTLAVVRISSHGCSATVVYADDNRSLLLGCAHMFWEHGSNRESAALRAKPMVIDGMPGKAGVGKTRVVAVNSHADLSLIEISTRMPHVAPIAVTPNPNRRLVSAGFDGMRWPMTIRPATRIKEEGGRTLTKERPNHGRSGGGLLDMDTGEIVGVCSGYESGPRRRVSLYDPIDLERTAWQEVNGYPGIYSSHSAILRFIKWPNPQGGK